MKANKIENFSSKEIEAWNEFHEKRTLELKTEFPDISPFDIENKVWLEYIAYKYSLSEPNPFSDKPSVMNALYTNDFGPDSRCFLKCFTHPSVTSIPEEALVSQNISISESKSTSDSKTKKPLSLYNFFFKKRLDEYRIKHPMMKIQEISHYIGKEWHSVSRQKVKDDYFIEFGTQPP